MTNTNWREEYKKAWTASCDEDGYPDIDDLEDFIDQCLKDQKAELLEKIEKEKKLQTDKHEELWQIDYRDGFNDCLEIIGGIIENK